MKGENFVMFSKKVEVTVPVGMHARPATLFVQVASHFSSSVFIDTGSARINAKSLLGVLSLGISQGQEITIIAEGKDEHEAIRVLYNLVKEDFDERKQAGEF
jgi:phosphotransferase system HPr (HPr) family protein